jgi:hypothetical protein
LKDRVCHYPTQVLVGTLARSLAGLCDSVKL